jgi:hypothetical protein
MHGICPWQLDLEQWLLHYMMSQLIFGTGVGTFFGNIEKRIKQLKKALEGCRRRGISRDTVDREAILKYKLQKLED